MTKQDRTFDDASMYGSLGWVSLTLGITKDTFHRKRATLEADGFPRADPITLMWIKADVMAWVHKRRKIPDERVTMGAPQPSMEIDSDAL